MRMGVFRCIMAILMMFCFAAPRAGAATAEVLDKQVDASIEMFKDTRGADSLIKDAAGLLVFPSIIKAGLIFGGEYGEGALRVDGKTAGYYNMAAASVGFQLGVQKKTVIMAFMTKQALDKFQASSGWKVGADASVAVIAIGAGGSIDTETINQPVVAFVLDQKGLMYNVTLEGAKISKIHK